MATLSDLKQDHKNARKRTETSASLLKESLQRYGPARSIVIDEDDRILAGNGTVEAAIGLGIEGLRIVDASPDEIIAVRRIGLTEDQKVGLALADNRTADLAEWDAEMLQQLSAEHDISPWFDDDDVEALLEQVEQLDPVEGKTDPDEVPEPPAEPTTKPGDLWILGNHRLLCGDSTNPQHVERLMDGQKAEMVFTDPPYAIYGSSTGVGDDVADTKMIQPFFREIFTSMALALDGHFYVCCDWRTYPILNNLLHGAGFAVKNMIVWDKVHMGMGMFYRNTHELIICGYPRLEKIKMRGKKTYGAVSDANVWSIQRESQKQHTAQKPIELAKRAIGNSSSKGEVVLDLFGGSGSTLIACEDLARKCRMMEMEPKYCDVIVKRWEAFTGNTAVCVPSETHFDDVEDDN